MSTSIVSDAAVASGGQKEHLIFEPVGGQRPAVTEDDRLSAAPILEENLCPVFGGNGAHCLCSLRALMVGSSCRVLGVRTLAPSKRSAAARPTALHRLYSCASQQWAKLSCKPGFRSRFDAGHSIVNGGSAGTAPLIIGARKRLDGRRHLLRGLDARAAPRVVRAREPSRQRATKRPGRRTTGRTRSGTACGRSRQI